MAARRRPITRQHDGVFAINLHGLIVKSDMTYSAIAEALGSRTTTIERILNHGAMPGGLFLLRVCNA